MHILIDISALSPRSDHIHASIFLVATPWVYLGKRLAIHPGSNFGTVGSLDDALEKGRFQVLYAISYWGSTAEGWPGRAPLKCRVQERGLIGL